MDFEEQVPDMIDQGIEEEQRVDYLPQYNEVGTPLQLQDKQIEPSESISGSDINRNLQLGNIGSRTYLDMLDTNSRAEIYDTVPMEYGGYLLGRFSEKQRKQNDFGVVLSVSIEGFGRKILATQRKEFFKSEDEKPRKRGIRDRFRLPS